MHARLKPKNHRFNYRVFSMLIDIDEFEKVEQKSRFFSVNKRNILSFNEKDHGPRDGTNLRKHVNKLFKDGGLKKPNRVLLWCNPRVLGYTFNPLSIYFCYNENNELTALIYQVHNTFGQDHSYVAEIQNNQKQSASIRQKANKKFYVSPFLDMDLCYNFRINEPSEELRIRILENDATGPILSATFYGVYKEANSLNLLKGLVQTIGLTWKIMAGIHYEAIFLWAKGIKIRKRPEPPKKTSYPYQEDMVPGE